MTFAMEPRSVLWPQPIIDQDVPRKPLLTPNGNTGISQLLVTILPEHTTYVEPFAGGASVFWRKNRSRREVLNDLDPEVALVYRIIQGMSGSEVDSLSTMDWLVTEERFAWLLTGRSGSSDLDRTHRLIYLALSSVGHARQQLRSELVGASLRIGARLSEWRERLKGVELTHGDYHSCITQWDDRDTLFYIDPPYPGEWSLPLAFSDEKWNQLVRRVQRLRGKVLLSSPCDLPGIPESWPRLVLEVVYDGAPARKEWLLANYPLPESLALPGDVARMAAPGLQVGV